MYFLLLVISSGACVLNFCCCCYDSVANLSPLYQYILRVPTYHYYYCSFAECTNHERTCWYCHQVKALLLRVQLYGRGGCARVKHVYLLVEPLARFRRAIDLIPLENIIKQTNNKLHRRALCPVLTNTAELTLIAYCAIAKNQNRVAKTHTYTGRVIASAQLPRGAVPAFLAVGGLFDADWRVAVACREGKVYTIKVLYLELYTGSLYTAHIIQRTHTCNAHTQQRQDVLK